MIVREHTGSMTELEFFVIMLLSCLVQSTCSGPQTLSRPLADEVRFQSAFFTITEGLWGGDVCAEQKLAAGHAEL